MYCPVSVFLVFCITKKGPAQTDNLCRTFYSLSGETFQISAAVISAIL